jgi:hypothetical protein
VSHVFASKFPEAYKINALDGILILEDDTKEIVI